MSPQAPHYPTWQNSVADHGRGLADVGISSGLDWAADDALLEGVKTRGSQWQLGWRCCDENCTLIISDDWRCIVREFEKAKDMYCATPILYQPAQNRHDWLSWTSPSGCWWHHPQTWLSWLVTGSRLGTWCHEPLRELWRWGLPSEETWGYTIRGDDYTIGCMEILVNIVDWVQMSSNVFNILGILTIQDNPWPGLFCH